MAKIVIVDDDPQVISYEVDFFESIEENNEIAVYKTRPSNSRELIQRVKDCHTIVVTKATTQITNSVIENSPNLRHIAVYGPALDHIDVDSANRNKIKVTSIPDILTNSVAEHTISLIMSFHHSLVKTFSFFMRCVFLLEASLRFLMYSNPDLNLAFFLGSLVLLKAALTL